MTEEPRIYPLVELGRDQIQRMLAPVLDGARVLDTEQIDKGLINTIVRVRLDRQSVEYAIRVYVGESWRFEMERELLAKLAGDVPVPRIVLADASGLHCPRPFFVYPWIDGITLNECRKVVSPEILLTMAKPLGQVLARLAACSAPEGRAIRFDTRIPSLNTWLKSGLPRERLGDRLSDRLLQGFEDNSPRLCESDKSAVLVHGDFGGRNILMKEQRLGHWVVAAVLDWEFASMGSELWDVASLFRYTERYPPAFRQLFADGYREAGGTLPDDWWWVSRWLDAARLVKILAEPMVLPSVFAECCDLLVSLVSK